MDEKITKDSKQIFTVSSAEGSFGWRHENDRGLNWWITGLFIVGQMVGVGILAMPSAMIDADLPAGIVTTILGALLSGYTGVQLGENWTMLQQRWPEYRHHSRKPYSAMGYRAMGKFFQHAVSVCVDFTQFSVAVVYLLLVSQNLETFLKTFFSVKVDYCLLMLIVAVFFLPITFLKSPKEFWFTMVAAMVLTSAAIVLMIVGSSVDYETCHPVATYNPIKFQKFFLAFGAIMFSYGGHSAFPTIQHDMKIPSQFNRSVYLAYGIIVVMYLPVCVLSYQVYGNSLQSSIILSLQTKWIQQTVNVIITFHVIMALTLVFNPINQEMEEIFKLPQSFGWKRVVTRTLMMVAVVFTAETVPTFGVILDLSGGSATTLLTMVFPGLFNLYLSVAHKKAGGKENTDHKATFYEVLTETPKIRLCANLLVIAFGLVGGVSATWAAIDEMVSTSFVYPCYVAPFIKNYTQGVVDTEGHTDCCGLYQNISIYGDPTQHCAAYYN
uniref:Amino acid transporter transmembrane domain-containing protein n=1 Tax=Plectus sambesii TaxID=2011161 RepID=A0A914V9T7_9BILA